MKLYFFTLLAGVGIVFLVCCNDGKKEITANNNSLYPIPDSLKIPNDKFGEMVRYGRQLMLNTSYYIGPNGINGQYLGNKMNCTNCHQDAGTKPFSFSLMLSHEKYPQYRAREGKVLSLAERVNNCVMRPHSGKPLPLDSKEMLAFLSYMKWMNSTLSAADKTKKGFESMEINFPDEAGSTERGEKLYNEKCLRCHSADGSGVFTAGDTGYVYPPLWGSFGYQPGSSMHRVIKQARWLKANMPYDSVKLNKPNLTDKEAIDIASFINDDRIHSRPNPKSPDYPFPNEKAIDYGIEPFADTFSAQQHKFGPYKPIIDYWKAKGLKPTY